MGTVQEETDEYGIERLQDGERRKKRKVGNKINRGIKCIQAMDDWEDYGTHWNEMAGPGGDHSEMREGGGDSYEVTDYLGLKHKLV